MVTPLSLYLLAAALLLLAGLVGWLRGLSPREARADWLTALAGTATPLLAAVALYAVAGAASAPDAWARAGSVALLASPLGALALAGRPRRSLPRAFAGAIVALAGMVLWLTANLRGPRGGWTAGDVAIVLPAAAIALSAAACLGWWSKGRRPGGEVAAGR